MRFGSLFAGIGGIDLGLERAGMKCAWQVEVDEFCRKVLAKHWPDVPRFEDVRECGAHNLEPVDLICGGFPCQDISNAGKRAGIDGERSGLWSEYARIVRELRPRYVLVENVAALLGRGLGTVLGDLAACGYDAEWDCIPAAAVGAPHLRDRIYLVAFPGGERCPRWAAEARRPAWLGAQGLRGSEPDSALAHSSSDGLEEQRVAVEGWELVADASGGRGLRENAGRAGHWWSTEPDVGRVAYGLPPDVDRLAALGNAVVPQVAEFIGRRLMAHVHSTNSETNPRSL